MMEDQLTYLVKERGGKEHGRKNGSQKGNREDSKKYCEVQTHMKNGIGRWEPDDGLAKGDQKQHKYE